MNLVKWFRKNNTKVMAVVVIVLMIGFIGGSSLTYLLRGRGNTNKKIAFYDNNIGIKSYDLMVAQQELDILEALQIGTILKMLQDPIDQTPNLQSLILGELLFSNQRPSQEVIAHIQQTAVKYQNRINRKQINDLYKLSASNFYYWFLLDKEAEKAGFKVEKDTARSFLSQALPRATGMYYSQFIGNMMRSIKISEDKILTVTGKLLAVLQFSHSICSGEDITIKQLKNLASSQMENVDIELVRFNSEKFINNLETPTEQQISEQYEKYKGFFPNEITSENPYGFGYKLPNRVQLEYMAVKLDDIKKIIKEPTFEEQSQFYNNNIKSNSSDPNYTPKPFSEVADEITDYLIQEKITQKAESILQEARTLADGSLQDFNDAELDKLSTEERKEIAGNYTNIAEQLSEKYNIKIYQDITGELSAEDIQTDNLLSKLYLEGYVSELSLARIVFGLEQFNMNLLGSYESIKPQIYVSVVPIKDKSSSGKIMATIRVVKAINSSIPESVDQTFSTKAFIFDPNEEDKKENTFSIKENVIKDVKCFAAMDTAKTKANEFLELAATQEDQVWENVIDKFNELYEQEYPSDSNSSLAEDSNEPPFKLEEHNSLTKLSKETLLTIIHNQDNPSSEGIKNLLTKESQFLDLIFSLAPHDSNAPEFKPEVVEFKPDLSYYIIKNISLNHLWKENYERAKSYLAYKKDLSESQSLALDQFNPANILKRMNFRFANDTEESSEQEAITEDE
ncbi:MAG: hypothetical protein JXA96_14745 [Sedimentisphaerales bacterium]|nr:hypothetical protein [Sedimentisphaerales bacterium]